MPEQTVERQARTRELASSDNARGLMVTVLGEFVLPTGGSAWTQTLIDAMELLGVQPKTTRQVLARLAERGWLDRTKVGRRTRWHLTPHSREVLESGAERIYGFGHGARDWDGTWLVLLASLSEREQAMRYRLTTGLNWAGFGSLGQGTWISPWTSRERDAVAVVREVGIDGATTFVATVGELGEGSELAARAWDFETVRTEYQSFLDIPIALGRSFLVGEEAVKFVAGHVHRWRRIPILDPDLPDELLPTNWPKSEAVSAFAQLRAELVSPALEWWGDTEARYGSTAA